MQSVPQPYHQISFQRDGVEIARYHYSPELNRPFFFPIIGPSGRPLTRMGHPHDPDSHSHHNSVWISHNDVNGVSFWDDKGKGRIIQRRFSIDGASESDRELYESMVNEWITDRGEFLVEETRGVQIQARPGKEWLMHLDINLTARDRAVTFGKTPFGLLGVRMAKTIGVKDGGGEIRNSEGGVNEKGVLWKVARWVDYSGPIMNTAVEGITILASDPTFFHVRDDGWMGACLTYGGPITIPPHGSKFIHYALYIHSGKPSPTLIEKVWRSAQGPRP